MKTVQYEVFPSMILYVMNIFVRACDLIFLITFFVCLAGHTLTIAGMYNPSYKGISSWVKAMRMSGRVIAHGSALLMILVTLNNIFRAGIPSYRAE